MDGLKASSVGYRKLRTILRDHKNSDKKTDETVLNKYREDFKNAINDDLNTPLALGIIWGMVRENEKSVDIYNLAVEFDKALGLGLDEVIEVEEIEITIPQNILDLCEQRLLARQSKNWAESDRLRDKINELGYVIKDTKEGYEVTLK